MPIELISKNQGVMANGILGSFTPQQSYYIERMHYTTKHYWDTLLGGCDLEMQAVR